MFQAHAICKAYHRQSVLRDVSFCLPAGHCLGITGENGSGKSTLLSILAQTLSPDSGSIRFQGRNVLGDRDFVRKCLGYVPQQPQLLPEFTGAQMLALWRNACGCRESLSPQVEEMLGLKELLPVKTAEMSGGMRQRISIAMAVSNSPKILIMDEATAGLDALYRENLLTWLEGFLHAGGRMVWCSHQPEEHRRLCGTTLPLGEF